MFRQPGVIAPPESQSHDRIVSKTEKLLEKVLLNPAVPVQKPRDLRQQIHNALVTQLTAPHDRDQVRKIVASVATDSARDTRVVSDPRILSKRMGQAKFATEFERVFGFRPT